MRQKRGKKVSRSEKARNDMEEKQEVRKVRRIFTPEQKFEILKDIERSKTIKEGLAKHELAQSLYHKWKRQLEVGVRASLRNSRPLKSSDLKRLEAENRSKRWCSTRRFC
jgi:transposase-like protein